MKKTTIIFIRHGEVENKKAILYGRLPGFKLSTRGIRQIRKVTKILQKKSISAIYTSPLLRTRQTAAILGQELHLKPKISSHLLEVNLLFKGMSIDQYKKDIQYRLYSNEFIKKGQESITSISNRMYKFVKIALKKHSGKTILAVSHGDPILILKIYTLNISFTWDYKRNNYLAHGKWLKLTTDGKTFHWT